MVRKIFTYTREEQKMNPGTLNSRVDENHVIAEERTGDELKESDCKGQVDYVLPSSEEEVEPSKLSESLSVTEEEDFPICLEAGHAVAASETRPHPITRTQSPNSSLNSAAETFHDGINKAAQADFAIYICK
ncbi:hypothetical protein IFM89_025780 [Coptis chinensis]|uniref:Uncharacterized protein n=1 Tax=Coptis chinensis TaxID=261450 RepID=A0A835LT26_9MAGN|nr:hypothetical protein IFM89_025780 [Coptis chinensis]